MISTGGNVVSAPLGPEDLFKGIGLRIASALVLIPLAVAAIWAGGWAFAALVGVFAGLMLWEWWTLTGRNAGWMAGGLVYVLVPCLALLWLRDQSGDAFLVLLLFVAIWSSDTGAYLMGRAIGGPKLAPAISPNKTWAGLAGAMLAPALVVMGVVIWRADGASASVQPSIGALLGAALGLVGQIGDLFESWVKRRFGVKDSGTLIPGHGGALDRLDSMLFVAPATALLMWVAR